MNFCNIRITVRKSVNKQSESELSKTCITFGIMSKQIRVYRYDSMIFFLQKLVMFANGICPRIQMIAVGGKVGKILLVAAVSFVAETKCTRIKSIFARRVMFFNS